MKLIATDIDGTLIDHTGRLPEANRTALAQAHARGVRVALATVRKRDAAEVIVRQLGLPCLLICEGGAAVYDERAAPLRTLTMPLELARAVAALADEHGLPLLTTVDEVSYFGPGSPAPRFMAKSGVDVERNLDALAGPPTRFIVRGARGVELLMQTFAGAPLRFVRHYLPDGSLYDAAITHLEATKELALEFLSARLEIPLAQTLAIGDAEADIGMLRAAGAGVAVGDARAPVREAADWVAPPAAQAGVAAAVRRFVLDAGGE